MRPSLPSWHPAALIATGFGIGLSPLAPGTCGSLAALPIAWAIRAIWGDPGLALVFGLVFAIGCWAAGDVAAANRDQDPGMVVVDEIAGQWLVLLATPVDPVAWLLAFLLFRLFDIWKPWPVRWADRNVKGGFGIMLDDTMAAGYALLVMMALLTIVGTLGVRI